MSTDITSAHGANILDQICTVIKDYRREIIIHYSEIKLRLPKDLKSVTISQIREAGGNVDPDITIPRAAKEQLRKSGNINEKIEEICGCFHDQVREYYNNVKKQLPTELLEKKMGDLTADEWRLLGFDMMKRTT